MDSDEKLTIEQCLDKMDAAGADNARVKYAKAVMSLVSGVTTKTLSEFQRDFNKDEGFDKFVVAQNKAIRECLALECSSAIGLLARLRLGLMPITMDTMVTIKGS